MTKKESKAHFKRFSLASRPAAHASFRESSDTSTLESWCYLIRDHRWGASQKRVLLQHFGSPQAILDASYDALKSIVPYKSKVVGQVPAKQIEQDLSWLKHLDHHLITLECPTYPKLLREIADPPIALFAIGNLALINEPQVAIVGSRRPTPVGAQVTKNIAKDLAELGIVITSGMALGIDGVAHKACLDHNEPSIAVLGCGLDIVYPARNKGLFSKLTEFGLIVSEYPLGVPPNKYTFPQRNRIVSGLSYGVVIIEAAERSGTLITARLCLEQDRELMVVPGSALSKQYQGSHRLLGEGACLVSNAADVLQQLSGELSSHIARSLSLGTSFEAVDAITPQPAALDTLQSESDMVLARVGAESTAVDSIISDCGLTAAKVSSILLELELEGLIAVECDGGYVNLT